MPNKIYKTVSWDRDFTHGGHPDFKYIRNRENADKLKIIAPYLQSAYKKRLERHIDAVKGKQLTIIGLLEKLVYIYQQRLNKK